eukprot:238813_1
MSTVWVASKWDSRIHGFCESSLDAKYEYGNIFSSLFLVFFGIYGLQQLPSPIIQPRAMWHVRLVYNLLICIGIGSTMFHYQLTVFWGLVDSLPMILTACIMLSYYLPLLLKLKLDQNNNNHNSKLLSFVSKFMTLLLIFFALSSIVLTALYGQHHDVFQLFTVIQFFVYWECDILNKEMAVHMMTAEDGESALKKWWYSAVVVLRFENKNVHFATQEAKNRQQSRSNVQTHNISCI